MKKMVFAGLLLAAVTTVSAQEVTLYRVHNPNNTSSMTTVTVPPHIRTAFETTHPNVTVISWQPMDAWWRASYKADNRVTYVFYNEAGVDYRVALPVLQNNVPEEVISTALNLYGPSVYGITHMKSADNTDMYQVKLMENGTSRVTWIDADGVAVSNVFREKDIENSVTINQ